MIMHWTLPASRSALALATAALLLVSPACGGSSDDDDVSDDGSDDDDGRLRGCEVTEDPDRAGRRR